MKTLFNSALKTLLFSTAVLVSSLTMAQRADQHNAYYEATTFDSAIYPAAAPSKMWVHIAKKVAGQALRIELLNAKGQVIASEMYPRKQPSVCTRFDLSDVGDGIYTFRISDGYQTQERTFKLTTPGFEEQLPKRLITMK